MRNRRHLRKQKKVIFPDLAVKNHQTHNSDDDISKYDGEEPTDKTLRRIEVMSPLRNQKQKLANIESSNQNSEKSSENDVKFTENFEPNIISAAKYLIGERLVNIILML